ncbi:MAG TPA: AtzH-like domain-containing protein [Acidimicrobiales bacterium]|nr:AtzH-like domain-containing protein [Acidimicrobiales bacterium]
MHEVNLPAVVDELAHTFERYERALVDRDLEVLGQFFTEHGDVVRFGVADRQHGPDELARWRASQPALPPGRSLAETTITTYGTDLGIVSTHFSYPGRPRIGRQSQTWLREDGRWCIVHAHVSEIPAPET